MEQFNLTKIKDNNAKLNGKIDINSHICAINNESASFTDTTNLSACPWTFKCRNSSYAWQAPEESIRSHVTPDRFAEINGTLSPLQSHSKSQPIAINHQESLNCSNYSSNFNPALSTSSTHLHPYMFQHQTSSKKTIHDNNYYYFQNDCRVGSENFSYEQSNNASLQYYSDPSKHGILDEFSNSPMNSSNSSASSFCGSEEGAAVSVNNYNSVSRSLYHYTNTFIGSEEKGDFIDQRKSSNRDRDPQDLLKYNDEHASTAHEKPSEDFRLMSSGKDVIHRPHEDTDLKEEWISNDYDYLGKLLCKKQ